MSDVKLIRKQLRNVIQSDLDEILKKEVFQNLEKQIAAVVNYRINEIQAQVTKTLKELDERSKDMQQFVMRQLIQQANQQVDSLANKPE